MKAMNISYFIIIWSSILLMFSNNVIGQKRQYDPSKLYSVEELKEDLTYTKNNLEKYNPGLYWYISKSQLDSLFDSIYQSINHPMDELEFFKIVYPIYQKIAEGHNQVFLSDKGHKWLKTKTKTFPFSLRCIDNRLFVHKNGSVDSSSQKGTEIKSINGFSASEIISKMKIIAVSDGKNTTSILRYDIEKHFWKFFYYFFNTSDSFLLEIQRVGSSEIDEVVVAGETRDAYEKTIVERYKVQESFKRAFTIREDSNTAILKVASFLNHKSDNELGIASNLEYFHYAFDELMDNPSVENLIIDLRENSGGSAGSEILLLSFLTNEENKVYKLVERNRWAPFFKRDSLQKYSSDKMLGYTNEPRANGFKGQVYVLTSGKTYSAASIVATALDQFTNAIIVGEETGGGFYGATAGNWKRLKTPNVKLDLVIPRIRFVINASGQPEGRGLLPDYEVTQTYEDFMLNVDTEMNFTLELIKEREEKVSSHK